METVNKIKLWIAALAGVLTGLWGWMGWLVVGWIVCMVLDYVTGCVGAWLTGEWSSEKARAGARHKLGMVWVVLVSAGTDLVLWAVLTFLPVISLPFDFRGLVTPVVLVWYILTELGSVAENAVTLGAPIPKWLPKLLAIGKTAVDKTGEALTDEADAEERDNDETDEMPPH